MLSLLRSFQRSPLAIVLIALLVLSFAVWGVGGIFTGTGTAVAIVGPKQVSVRDLSQAYQQETRRIQEENPQVTQEQMRQAGVGDQVLQRLIVQAAFSAKAEDLGLAISEDTVFDTAASFEAFRSPVTGQYDYQSMVQALAMSGLTEDQFFDNLHGDLLRGQLVDSLTMGIQAPPTLSQSRFSVAQEQRQLRGLFIDPSTADAIEDPTDEQLQAFIDANQALTDGLGLPLFVAPEFRSISLVRFQIEDFIRDVEVDESVLRETYDFQLETGQLGTPATRSFEQWLAADETIATALATRLSAGEDADALEAELGLGSALVQTDLQPYQVPDTAVADRVFELPAGAIEAIEGDFGWVVVSVTGAVDAVIPSYEELLPDLRAEAARAEATDAMYDKMAAFEQARANGMSLEGAAEEAGVPLEIYAPLDQFSRDQDGEFEIGRYTSLGTEILPVAFEQFPGFAIDIRQYGEGNWFTLRVDEVITSRPRELDEVRDMADARWRAEQVDIQLQARVDEALAQLQDGENIDMVALTSGGRVETTTLTRDATAGGFTAQVVRQAFSQSLGEPQSLLNRAVGAPHVIIVVDEVILPDPANIPPLEIISLTNGITNELAEDILQATQSGLLAEYDVTAESVDPRLRAIALGEDTDQNR